MLQIEGIKAKIQRTDRPKSRRSLTGHMCTSIILLNRPFASRTSLRRSVDLRHRCCILFLPLLHLLPHSRKFRVQSLSLCRGLLLYSYSSKLLCMCSSLSFLLRPPVLQVILPCKPLVFFFLLSDCDSGRSLSMSICDVKLSGSARNASYSSHVRRECQGTEWWKHERKLQYKQRTIG